MVKSGTTEKRERHSLNRERAKQMRHEPVAMEKLFWSIVRNRQIGGHEFRRQYLVGNYIVDFVCVECKLIIELDGALHSDRREYDSRRDDYLQGLGYRVMRFTNEELAGDVAAMRSAILHMLDTPSP